MMRPAAIVIYLLNLGVEAIPVATSPSDHLRRTGRL